MQEGNYKIMKNCFHGDYFKSYLPTKPGIFYCFKILEWVYMH